VAESEPVRLRAYQELAARFTAREGEMGWCGGSADDLVWGVHVSQRGCL